MYVSSDSFRRVPKGPNHSVRPVLLLFWGFYLCWVVGSDIFLHHVLNVFPCLIDFGVFYGDADRLNSIREFKIPEHKTHIIKFGVDTKFWSYKNNNSFCSNYLFSIGQDPARDFETLLNVKTKKKIHIHTSLLEKKDDKNFRITNGSYNNGL